MSQIKSARSSFRRLYGAGPLHLLGALASLAVVAVAMSGWFEEPAVSLKYILIWFLGAVLAHDLLLLPLYSTLDRVARIQLHRDQADRVRPEGRVQGWVYLRVPILLSGLILLVFGAEIFKRGEATFHVASGQSQSVYLHRYLIVVAVLFGLSGLAYAYTRLRARLRRST